MGVSGGAVARAPVGGIPVVDDAGRVVGNIDLTEVRTVNKGEP